MLAPTHSLRQTLGPHLSPHHPTFPTQVQQLRSTQQYLYWRERRHRQTVDSTNWRVWWYAILRNAALIATSVAQVLFVRRMFAKS